MPTARTANGGGQVTLIHATDDDTTKLNVGNALDDSDNSLTLLSLLLSYWNWSIDSFKVNQKKQTTIFTLHFFIYPTFCSLN